MECGDLKGKQESEVCSRHFISFLMLLLYFLSDMYTEMSNLRTSLALCASVARCATLCLSGVARWRGGADHQDAAAALFAKGGHRPPH
jgi:hypothetical protein